MTEKPAQGLIQDYGSPRWSAEISDCSLPMTFDTYSNCAYGCVYCFSQFQRGIGKTKDAYTHKIVRSVNPQKVKDLFLLRKESQFNPWIAARRPFQWGGLSDQFDEFERKYGITLELLKFFKEINYPISFSTKAAWPFFDERYRELFRGQDNWHMKFSIITMNERAARKIERGVPSPQRRLEAMREWAQLSKGGTTLRLRPFIVGVSDKDYKDMIVAAHDAGADSVTTEFFCLEVRAVNARKNYEAISEAAGFDILDFYKRYSSGAGYLRLNRKVKEPYIKEMHALCNKLGMRFYVSDAHFKEACDNSCCCGMREDYEFSRGNFSAALQMCRSKGSVTWAEIEKDMEYLNFPWAKAEGYNCNSTEKRAKFEYMSMKDYLRYLWNNPRAGQSPYKMFEGVMKPDGMDSSGNIIYKYDQQRTYIPARSTGKISGEAEQ